MREVIEIEGEVVRLLRCGGHGGKVLDQELPLTAFLQALQRCTNDFRHIPLLPVGTRFVVERGADLVVAVEQPPQVRHFPWRPGGMRGPDRDYSLAFPYIVYLLVFHRGNFEEMRVYYRPAPLVAETDPLFLSNLWNVSATDAPMARCRACLQGRPPLEDLSLVAQVQGVIAFFWGTGFNTAIEESCFQHAGRRDHRIATLEAWEGASRADALFPLDIPWEALGMGLREAAEGLMTWRGTAAPIVEAADLVDLIYRV
jgi:hypothetical protein